MGIVEHRRLPVYGADAFEVPFVIAGASEQITRNTHWDDHSHPTHELLWNERGASTATIGSRTWTVTPSVGLWIPAGVLHSGWMPAGTWYRAAQFSVVSVPSISADAVAVEISPLLRLLLERLAGELEPDIRSRTEAVAHHAITELVQGMPIDDVAATVGYTSASAFGTAFRRITGESPGRFRAS